MYRNRYLNWVDWEEIPENADNDYYIDGEYFSEDQIRILERCESDADEKLAKKIIMKNGNRCPVCGSELMTSADGDTLVLDAATNELICCESCFHKASDKWDWPVPDGWYPTDYDDVGERHWIRKA